MKMFKVSSWENLIEEVEVLRANDKSVWTLSTWTGKSREERSSRISNYHRYFDTKKEAKAFVIERCNNKIKAAKRAIAEAEADLKSITEY